jgi:ergothioneine biosynthesis protein EgtB
MHDRTSGEVFEVTRAALHPKSRSMETRPAPSPSPSNGPEETRVVWRERYERCRAATETLTVPLSDEDQQVQSMPLASPTKWHRAHTTWFFETFLLEPAGIAAYDARFGVLFNSYYDGVGPRVARDKRGLMSRPTARDVAAYRRAVDERLLVFLGSLDAASFARVAPLLELGLAHEEQHQELILTDILHAFSENPCAPTYREGRVPSPTVTAPFSWLAQPGGVVEVGAAGGAFAFDNERPRHRVYLDDYLLASRPGSVGDVKEFIRAGGYERPSLWLSQGFELARSSGWRAPGHARCDADGYRVFTLRGWHMPHDADPASHLSFWEADAIARFLGGRLPTEAEWEHAAREDDAAAGNFADGPLVPVAPCLAEQPDFFGSVWEWTRSSYDPYPGYRVPAGAVGEYNGKFMAQQMVLRGGSCLTPRGHVRESYRNFWAPDTRFQMTGVRIAKDAR